MSSFFSKITGLGTSGLKNEYEKDLVTLSNTISIILFFVGIGCVVLLSFWAPQFAKAIYGLIAVGIIVPFLNYLQFSMLSRFTLNLLICATISGFHASIVQPGEDLLYSLFLSQFAAAILPWLYIDLREKPLLISSLVISFGLFFGQFWISDLINIEGDSSIFRTTRFELLATVLASAVLAYCIYILQSKNLDANLNNEKLLEDIKIRSDEMEQQKDELLKTLEENKTAAEEEEKRNWIAKGISDISGLLREDLGDQLHQKLVSAIVKYMKVNQAGFYLIDERPRTEEKFLELKACYAFDRLKYLDKTIDVGQGLVGQCCQEKERILLKKVPESYLNIRSGLGDASARSVLIEPLIYEGNVEGVLELASFNQLEEHEIEFVEKLSEALAAFFSTNKINTRTKELLAKFQQQSEELRAQEEEMRQNMEEMQATQEEISRKEKEYINRIAELEKEVSAFKTS